MLQTAQLKEHTYPIHLSLNPKILDIKLKKFDGCPVGFPSGFGLLFLHCSPIPFFRTGKAYSLFEAYNLSYKNVACHTKWLP